MRFGIREICDVVFKAKSTVTIGSKTFKKGQPVLYIDSAKTSTIEGAATTVYATGGRGNTRLISWEGEKTLTFTVEDALLSPIGFSVLSGAGLFDQLKEDEKVHVHRTTNTTIDANGVIDLGEALGKGEKICKDAPCFVVLAEADGSLKGTTLNVTVDADSSTLTITGGQSYEVGEAVFCDYYVLKAGNTVSELQIDAANFAGYYYVEASTLFRRQNDGKDLPAEITFPNVKIQSNFTFTMASTGDPSTFTFTMDAMPGYTYFDKNKKVLCVMQIIDETAEPNPDTNSVMQHETKEPYHEDMNDVAEKKSTFTGDGPVYTIDGNIVSWDPVAGATKYEISYSVTDDKGKTTIYEQDINGTSFVLPANAKDVALYAFDGTVRSAAGTEPEEDE